MPREELPRGEDVRDVQQQHPPRRPAGRDMSRRGVLVIFAAGILAVLAGSLVGSSTEAVATTVTADEVAPEPTTAQEPAWKTIDATVGAYIMTESFARRQLELPRTAAFPSVWDGRYDHVRRLSDQRYRVRSWVEAQNASGAMVRTHFTAEIERVGEDEWVLREMAVRE